MVRVKPTPAYHSLPMVSTWWSELRSLARFSIWTTAALKPTLSLIRLILGLKQEIARQISHSTRKWTSPSKKPVFDLSPILVAHNVLNFFSLAGPFSTPIAFITMSLLFPLALLDGLLSLRNRSPWGTLSTFSLVVSQDHIVCDSWSDIYDLMDRLLMPSM